MIAWRIFAVVSLWCIAFAGVGSVWAVEQIRIAVIEPLSGPLANAGNNSLHSLEAEVDMLNAEGGVLGRRLEVVPFDNKLNPQAANMQLQRAIDLGIRYVAQATASSIGHAVSEAVAKHNARNPDRPVLYLNFGALDAALTTEKCNFWHFRFAAHSEMLVAAMTDALAQHARAKRLYLINQDYAWGHSVARLSKAMLASKRPDLEVVGEDLHPLGKVKDFSPYVAKMHAALADTVLTGNFGNDLALLVKAAKDAGLQADFFALMAPLTGGPAAIAEAGSDRIRAVAYWHINLDDNPLLTQALAFRAKYQEDFHWLPAKLAVRMLAEAMNKSQSVNPVDVALALEGMRYAGATGDVWMRPEDHQLMMPIYQVRFARVGEPGVKYGAEGTAFGWKTERRFDAMETVTPATCRVQRP